jgi:hypothetical protein
MRSVARRRSEPSLACLVVSLLVLAVSGCNKNGGLRPDQIEQVANLPNKVPVARFAGHVSVDGQAPSQDGTLFLILNDPQHLVKGGTTYTSCDENGNFTFTTYLPGDGAPTGKYVLTFVQFHLGGAAARGGRNPGVRSLSLSQDYGGTDGLQNLYSDPEKNKDNPNFVVEIAQPGRTDYDFPLTVAGKDPVKTPGAYAATQLKVAVAPKL